MGGDTVSWDLMLVYDYGIKCMSVTLIRWCRYASQLSTLLQQAVALKRSGKIDEVQPLVSVVSRALIS